MCIDLYPVRLQNGLICHMSIQDLIVYAKNTNQNPIDVARKISLHVYTLVLIAMFHGPT